MSRQWIKINPGNSVLKPFLSITQVNGASRFNLQVTDITPEKLRSLADELEAILNRRAEVAFALSKAKTGQE